MENKPFCAFPVPVGMPTLMELPDLEENTVLCSRLGMDFVELNMNLPYCQKLDAGLLREIREQSGIFFTLHLDENLNVCEFNPRVAAAWRETALDALHLALAIGAPVVNMHLAPGVFFRLPDRKAYLFEEYSAHYLGALKEFRRRCEEAVGTGNVTICVENCGGFRPHERQGIELLLESPVFGLTWDVGHDFCAGGIDRDFIETHMPRLRHMHLHDARDGQCHLVPGTGEIDFHRMLRAAAEADCRCVLEVKTVSALTQAAASLAKLAAGNTGSL